MRRRPPHGAARPVTDALALVRRSIPAGRSVLVRVDSALYYHALVRPACKAGADVSITMQMLPTVRPEFHKLTSFPAASLGSLQVTSFNMPRAGH